MPKSLAELRTSKHTSLPERSYSLCLAAGLVAEVQALLQEKDDLAVKQRGAVDAEGNPVAPPKRLSDSPSPRLGEIDERLRDLFSEMDDHTGELRLRAVADGEWRRWVDDHPVRDENVRDQDITYGVCNADALMLELGKWAHTWNAEPIDAADWAFIESKAATGDLKQIARTVVMMHEMAADLGKLRAVSLVSPGSEKD